MSIHMQTGNRLDVVYTWDCGRRIFLGIQPHGGKLIPLPDPRGLAEAILFIVNECESINAARAAVEESAL